MPAYHRLPAAVPSEYWRTQANAELHTRDRTLYATALADSIIGGEVGWRQVSTDAGATDLLRHHRRRWQRRAFCVR